MGKYDFDGSDPDDLPFKKGELLTVVSKVARMDASFISVILGQIHFFSYGLIYFSNVNKSTFHIWTNHLCSCGPILCVQDEEQWWTARNSLGQTGSIPVPYVAKVNSTLEPEHLYSTL